MRFPDKEAHPFAHPCWKADDIAHYTGPVFRCTVAYVSKVDGSRQVSDHEAPSTQALSACLTAHLGDESAVYSYGPHTESQRPGTLAEGDRVQLGELEGTVRLNDGRGFFVRYDDGTEQRYCDGDAWPFIITHMPVI